MPSAIEEASAHLVAVARCPIVADCLTGRTPDHPCARLVLAQWPREVAVETRADAWQRWHQLPEPWMGHLRTAPLLFVASNPGLGGKGIPRNGLDGRAREHLTTWERDDEEIIRRAINGFEAADLSASPYWRDTHDRAVEAFNEDVAPGFDYALTEVVRCKSPGESQAVTSARGVCSRSYLHATIVLSGARVILGMGVHARTALTRILQLEDRRANYHETLIGPRRFIIAMLPHPNSRLAPDEKTLGHAVTPEQQETIRRTLASGRPRPARA
jgi:hypothetical protein